MSSTLQPQKVSPADNAATAAPAPPAPPPTAAATPPLSPPSAAHPESAFSPRLAPIPPATEPTTEAAAERANKPPTDSASSLVPTLDDTTSATVSAPPSDAPAAVTAGITPSGPTSPGSNIIPESQLGRSNSEMSDRAFPIRSVTSIKPAKRSSTEPNGCLTASPSAPQVDTEMAREHNSFAAPVPVSPFSLGSPAKHFVRPSRRNTITGSTSSVTADASRRSSAGPIPTVMDAKTAPRPVRFHDEYFNSPGSLRTSSNEHAPPPTFKTSTKQMKPDLFTFKMDLLTSTKATITKSNQLRLQVLVAEDDPINVKTLRKRLEQAGHQVHHTANGRDCAAVYKEKRAIFDVVLMDMQMPIVDGLTSTKMIRAFEGSLPAAPLSSPAATHGRIPIIAVSASLLESEKDIYLSAGLDGWIPKPVNFKRLNILLTGIVNNAVRSQCLYTKGNWEKGGWFTTGGFSNSLLF